MHGDPWGFLECFPPLSFQTLMSHGYSVILVRQGSYEEDIKLLKIQCLKRWHIPRLEAETNADTYSFLCCGYAAKLGQEVERA